MLTVVVVAALFMPSAAAQAGYADRQSLDGDDRAYTCEAPVRDMAVAPPPPKFSPDKQDAIDQQSRLLAADPDCPEGTVVTPRVAEEPKGSPVLAEAQVVAQSDTKGFASATTSAPRGAPKRRKRLGSEGRHPTAKLQRVYQYGAWYWYAGGFQFVPSQQSTYALFGQQSNEKPYIQYSNATEHSISQLWGIDETPGGAGSTQELGWRVSFSSYGDLEPHLFVYHFDGGVPTGYGQGLIPYTNVVGNGSVLPHNDTFHTYGIQRSGDNWWFYYDGYWIGYLPRSAYSRYWNAGFTRVDAGGEVQSSNSNTCGDMGSYGPIPGTSATAAMWRQLYRIRGDSNASVFLNLAANQPDPSQYSLGFFTGSSFRYGGGGYC